MQHGEKFNTVSHLLAALLALPGVIYLIILATQTGDPYKIVSVSIYGTTLMLLYMASTIYHYHGGPYKKILQKLDHLSIYLLIAGTYTPFMLVTLRGAWGWSILGVVWGLAFIGMLLDLKPKFKPENKGAKQDDKDAQQEDKRIPQLIIYLIMGWLVVIPLKPLSEQLSSYGTTLLAVGGILYTLGIIFFILDHRVKHAHGIWHLFVIGGSVSHYVSITAYVV
jgi:hemolysin III